MTTVVTALPKTGTIGQKVIFNGYTYQWSGVGWKNLGVATVNVGGANGTNISANGVSTGNLTSNSVTTTIVTTGNTSITSNGVTTGNTTVSANGLSTGNTSITSNGVTTGNTTVSANGVSVGNVSVSNTGVNVGNVALSNTGVNVGNVSLSDTGVNVGNVTLSNTGVNVGNVTLSNTGVNVGNVALSNTGVNVGNVSLSDTGVNVGNVTLSNTGVNVGNVTLSNTGVNVGNVALSNTGVNVGNVTLSDTGVNVGNVSVSNTGVNVGNVTLSNTGVNVGNVTLSNTGVNVGNVALSNTGVNVGNVSLSNTGVNVGNVTLSNTGLSTGNTNITSTGITATGGDFIDLTANGNVTFSGPNVILGSVGNLHISGGTSNYVLSTDGAGNLSWVSGSTALGGGANVLVKSSVTSIVVGSALNFSVDYSNTTYPGGIFTLDQLGPISLSTTTAWASGGTSKNAYANFISSTVNTQNISITLSLANATFDIKSSDTITIGGSTVTGANLTGLGIANTGGTYTIPSSFLTPVVQTQATNTVSVNLTTNRNTQSSSGTTLTNNQPVPFNVTAISGTFANSTVPYWSLDQTFNWNATVTAGATGITGNVTYANATASISGSLTSSGAISGTSTAIDSTYSYTLTSSDYNGTGGFGAGQRTIPNTVTGTVNPATKYYPLFWKTTSNSTVPTFTTSDSRNSNNFTVGQSANTTAVSTNYLWMATPNSNARTFKHIFLGSDIIDTPDVTGNITISGQAYRVWGFTNFSAVTAIITTS